MTPPRTAPLPGAATAVATDRAAPPRGAWRWATRAGPGGALLAAALGCAGVAREPFEASVTRVAQTRSLAATVERLAQPLIDAHRNIGMVIAVTTPDGDGVFTYGTQDRDGRVPMTRDAVFQVGSVTKSFTALLAAQLEREHRLRIDAPAAQLLPPGMPLASGDLARVTLGELASHTSGMPHECYNAELLWGVASYLATGKNLYRFLDARILTDYLSTVGFEAPEAKTYAYSNIGIVYLGWLLGQVDHKGYRRLLQEEVLTPLGLTHTGLSLPSTGGRNLAPGYAGDLPTFVPRHTPVDPWLFDEGIAAAGGLYSTADDLLTYAKVNLGTLASPLAPALAATRRPRAAAEGGSIGMAWFLKTLPDTGKPYTYIAGITGGHTSFVGFDEQRKVGVVVLENSINHDDMIGVMLLDRLVGVELTLRDGVPPGRIRRVAAAPPPARGGGVLAELPRAGQRSK